jgi:hypothetical protein
MEEQGQICAVGIRNGTAWIDVTGIAWEKQGHEWQRKAIARRGVEATVDAGICTGTASTRKEWHRNWQSSEVKSKGRVLS